MRSRSSEPRLRILAGFLCAALLLTLAPQTCAQQVSSVLLQAAQEAYQQAQQKQPEILPPAQVDPKLVGKKVVVHCRDGRVYKGKLTELTPELIRVKTRRALEEIALAEVSRVNKQPSHVLRNALIVGMSAAAVAIILMVIGSTDN